MRAPNATNWLLITASLFLIGGVFAFAEYHNTENKKVVWVDAVATSTDQKLIEDINVQDADGDGLPDWQETLTGTNAHNSDTDGDGMNDGDEMKKGRDPLKKGPNDKLITATDAATDPEKKLNATQKFSRDFFAKYMVLRQSGTANSATVQQELVEDLIANGITLEPKSYSKKEIKVTSDNSAGAVKKYGNDLALIFKRYGIKSRNEGVIMKESTEAKDDKQKAAILKELDPIVISYQNLTKALIALPIPATVASAHLELVNDLSTALFAVQSMQKMYTDPVIAIQGLKYYSDLQPVMIASMQNIKTLLKQNGANYETTEPGSMFN